MERYASFTLRMPERAGRRDPAPGGPAALAAGERRARGAGRQRRARRAARRPQQARVLRGALSPRCAARRRCAGADAVVLRAAGRPRQRPASMRSALRRKQAAPQGQPARLRAQPPTPTPRPLRHIPSALQALRRRAPSTRACSPPPPLGARQGRMRCWSASLLRVNLRGRHSTPTPVPAALAATRSRSAPARPAPAGCPAPSRALRGPGARGGGPMPERPPRPRPSSAQARARHSRGRHHRRPSGTRAGVPLAAAACGWTPQPCPLPGGRPGRHLRGAPDRPRLADGALWAPRRRVRPSRAAVRTAARADTWGDPWAARPRAPARPGALVRLPPGEATPAADISRSGRMPRGARQCAPARLRRRAARLAAAEPGCGRRRPRRAPQQPPAAQDLSGSLRCSPTRPEKQQRRAPRCPPPLLLRQPLRAAPPVRHACAATGSCPARARRWCYMARPGPRRTRWPLLSWAPGGTRSDWRTAARRPTRRSQRWAAGAAALTTPAVSVRPPALRPRAQRTKQGTGLAAARGCPSLRRWTHACWRACARSTRAPAAPASGAPLFPFRALRMHLLALCASLLPECCVRPCLHPLKRAAKNQS
jgi:hypothetical protein